MVREGRAEESREQGWNSPRTAQVVRVTREERGPWAALILHHTGNSTLHLWVWSGGAFMAQKAVDGKGRRLKEGGGRKLLSAEC